jgi:mycoredoxin
MVSPRFREVKLRAPSSPAVYLGAPEEFCGTFPDSPDPRTPRSGRLPLGPILGSFTSTGDRLAMYRYRGGSMSTADLNDFIPEQGSVTMFSTEWCGYCKRLKLMLDKTGIGYTVVNIEETPGTEDLVKSVNGGNAVVPTLVFPDGKTATNPSLQEVQALLGA